MVERGKDKALSVRRQCELLGATRSSLYYEPVGESPENLELMREIDGWHLKDPSAGSRRLRALLSTPERPVNRKRVQGLMRRMGIESRSPKPRTTTPGEPSLVAPYLLKGLKITGPDHVWSTDITYIPMATGFFYLCAVIDLFTRRIVGWELSNTIDANLVVGALNRAVERAGGVPNIVNSDQGSQYTSKPWRERLEELDIRISMDGKGRWIDNVYIERFWRSLKYEEVYLKAYRDGPEAEREIGRWIDWYNTGRPHSMLPGESTPEAFHHAHLNRSAA